MKTILPIAGLSLLCLNSCFQLQVGEIIRTRGEWADMADPALPLDQKAYKISENEYVYQAAIMRRSHQVSLIHLNIFNNEKSPNTHLTEPKPTGQYQWVSAKREKAGENFNVTLLAEPPNLSRAQLVSTRAFVYDEGFPSTFYVGTGLVSNPTTTQTILAAPFDYVIDPIASVPLTVVGYAAYALIIPSSLLYYYIFEAGQHEDNSPREDEIRINRDYRKLRGRMSDEE